MSKVALVVGGGKVWAPSFARGWPEAGYRVAVADMDADSAKLTASEIAEVHGAENDGRAGQCHPGSGCAAHGRCRR